MQIRFCHIITSGITSAAGTVWYSPLNLANPLKFTTFVTHPDVTVSYRDFRVFEPIIGFNAQASATSLSWLIYNDFRSGDGAMLFGSAAATSILTIIGVSILLTPIIVRTWQSSKPAVRG